MFDFLKPARGAGSDIPVTLVTPADLADWRTQNKSLAGQLDHMNFTARAGETAILRDKEGQTAQVLFGVQRPLKFYDTCALPLALCRALPPKIIEAARFAIANDLPPLEKMSACAAWALGCAQMKWDKSFAVLPVLSVAEDKATQQAQSYVEAIVLLRDLVNKPANLLGPYELEQAAIALARDIGATHTNVIRDVELLEQNFPLIFAVGQASTRRPRLIEFTWGNPKNPRVTIIGKGVCFDTGGLNLKPSEMLKQYKRDMGGSAHALALAKLIADHNLPIFMHVLIPAVENSIDGNAFRPSDVFPSRKGITVEIGNTDAEGRLVLADTITYAFECGKPDLIMDFATLTGIRNMIGTDFQGLFANKDETAQAIERLALDLHDPLWHLPLWHGYREDLLSDVADICSTGNRAGTVNAALFLQAFVGMEQDWVHIDMYSWRDAPAPGRPKGGFETGLRAVFAYLQERYG